MFTKINKWEFHPFQISEWTPKPIQGIEYGKWKIVDRYIELQCVANCKAPNYSFDFIENRVREIEEDGYWTQLKDDYALLTIAFYPIYGSSEDMMLQALSNGDVRGEVEKSATHRAFWFFFMEHFDDSKKFIAGRWKENTNPIPAFFPEWWDYWQKMTKKEP